MNATEAILYGAGVIVRRSPAQPASLDDEAVLVCVHLPDDVGPALVRRCRGWARGLRVPLQTSAVDVIALLLECWSLAFDDPERMLATPGTDRLVELRDWCFERALAHGQAGERREQAMAEDCAFLLEDLRVQVEKETGER